MPTHTWDEHHLADFSRYLAAHATRSATSAGVMTGFFRAQSKLSFAAVAVSENAALAGFAPRAATQHLRNGLALAGCLLHEMLQLPHALTAACFTTSRVIVDLAGRSRVAMTLGLRTSHVSTPV